MKVDMMDEEAILKNLKTIFSLEILTSIFGVTIMVLITIVGVNVDNFDASYYVGMVLCGIFAVGFPIVVCVLSGIGKVQLRANPKLIYIFSIITLAAGIGSSGACIIGAASIGNSIETDIYWMEHSGNPLIYMVNLGLHIAVTALFVGLVIFLILVIIKAANNIKLSSGVMGFSTASSAPRASSSTPATSGGNFCSRCGTSNAPDAKFCNKCGKTM